MHSKLKSNNQGFTIVELLIATAVFAIVLLIVTVAVLYVTNTYVKGDVDAQTQDTTRSVLQTIAQAIQFNKSSSVSLTSNNGGSGNGYFCIGNNVYVYQLNKEIGSNTAAGQVPHALLVLGGNNPTCPSGGSLPAKFVGYLHAANGGGSGNHELLAHDLRLGQLSITQPISGKPTFKISLTVGYGNEFAATPIKAYSCPQESFGGQFCDVSTLTTTVSSRIH